MVEYIAVMPILSVPAHFDGVHVRLDEEIMLPQNARLIVTVIDEHDPDRDNFLALSANALGAAYDEEEVEYTQEDLQA